MNKILIAVVMTFVIIILIGCTSSECIDGYAEYKPIFVDLTKLGDEIYFYDKSRVKPEHYENIKFVFEHYKVKHKVVDNKILVACRTWKNKEFMWNMTTKAEDEEWIRFHRSAYRFQNE